MQPANGPPERACGSAASVEGKTAKRGAIAAATSALELARDERGPWLAAVLRTVITQYLLPRRDGGRVAAVELVPVTTAVTNLMRKGDLQMLASAIQTGRDAGMIPLERSLARLVESGVVSPQVVKKIAADHDLLAALTATGALSR